MVRSYLIVALIAVIILFLGFHFWSRKHDKAKASIKIKQEPILGVAPEEIEDTPEEITDRSLDYCEEESMIAEPAEVTEVIKSTTESSSFDPNTIIMQLRANSGRPFMGYELHQTLLANNFRFGDDLLFHRYERDDGTGPVLFSLAAATKSGAFEIHNMGAFSCGGLVMFMHLGPKKKLMRAFDLMLDTARQIIEDLGGEIINEIDQPVDAAIIKQWREKICTFEDKNLYTTDLLDNL